MSNFSDFYEELTGLAAKFSDMRLKVEADPDSDIVKIFGERSTSLFRAKNGLDDVAELSVTAAEHHPYWNLLSQCCQICSLALDRWNDDLTETEIDEIKWSISQLDSTCKKLRERHRQR